MRGDGATTGHRRVRRDLTDEPREGDAAGGRRAHLPLEDEIGSICAPAEMPRRRLEERALGDEPHDLAPRRRHAEGLGLHLHHLVGAVQRGRVEVDQIHRDLRLPIDLEPEPLHALEATGGATDRLRDRFGDREVLLAAEVDVEGHEEGARADHGGASGGMDRVGAEVGDAGGIGTDRGLGPLELPAPDVGEVRAIGT